jgi:BirA family biotin operon repressor/biotin-[acetyl-CoA-carboxylase] ligase
VLPELRDGKLVLGVGVNVNMSESQLPADTRVPATSLQIATGAPADRVELLVALLAGLERRYDAFERDGFTGLERDELRGRHVTLVGAGSGVSGGVDDDGRLLLDGRAYSSAEVERVELP